MDHETQNGAAVDKSILRFFGLPLNGNHVANREAKLRLNLVNDALLALIEIIPPGATVQFKISPSAIIIPGRPSGHTESIIVTRPSAYLEGFASRGADAKKANDLQEKGEGGTNEN